MNKSIFSIIFAAFITFMKKQETHPNGFMRKFKKRNIITYILASIAASVIIIYVAIYLAVPSYRFEDPVPFKGRFIYNPYQNLAETKWQYLDFRNDTYEKIQLPVYEYGYGVFPIRYLCIDYESKRKIDYAFFQNIHYKQYNINCLNKNCGLVVPAHPSKGFKIREMKHLDNYRVLEVLSPLGKHLDYWDMALSSGRRVNILASNMFDAEDDFVSKTVVNQVDDDKKSVISSLKNGDSYAITYKKNNIDIPELRSVDLHNDTVFVTASKMINEIRFIGQDGMLKDSLIDVNQGVYAFSDDDTYIRVEMNFDNGTTIYLNPLVRHEFQYFFDPALTTMMKARTWLMRFVYIFAFVFFVKYLLFNRKEENAA